MKKGNKGKLYIGLAAAAVAVAVLALVLRPGTDAAPDADPAVPATIEMSHGVVLTHIGAYTGPFVEDGSDRPMENIAAVTLENRGGDDIQLGRVTVAAEDGASYSFEFTTLPAGESLSVLEVNGAAYDPAHGIIGAALDNVALFPGPLTLCSDVFELSLADGSIGVKNISGKAISGGRVFYKSISGSALVGGITYMTTVPALDAGEEVTLSAGHFSLSGSRLMFATYAE